MTVDESTPGFNLTHQQTDERRLVSPYTNREEHERQSLAGTHAFHDSCFFCLYDYYQEHAAQPSAEILILYKGLTTEQLDTAIAIADLHNPYWRENK